MFRTIALTGFAALIAATTISLAPPAHAQIGNIFSDPAPRPPGAIPRGNQQQQPAPDDDEEVPELPRGRLLPTPNRPLPGQGVPPPGSVQSQPLAPPPGTTVIPQNTQPGIAIAPPQPGGPAGPGVANAPPSANALPGLPPGQRQPKSVPGTPATLQPGDEEVTEPPASKVTNKKASFSGLDKITGRIINFDEDIGETVQFGALRVKTDACYTRPSTEAANTDAFVERPSSPQRPIRRRPWRRRRRCKSARRRRSRPPRVRRRSRNSSSSRNSRHLRRSGRAGCSVDCSGTSRASR